MSPESITALGVVIAAAITAGPAYFAVKARGARQEAEATRSETADSMATGLARLHGRLDHMTTQLDRIERWQVRHEVEHIASTPYPQGDQ